MYTLDSCLVHTDKPGRSDSTLLTNSNEQRNAQMWNARVFQPVMYVLRHCSTYHADILYTSTCTPVSYRDVNRNSPVVDNYFKQVASLLEGDIVHRHPLF